MIKIDRASFSLRLIDEDTEQPCGACIAFTATGNSRKFQGTQTYGHSGSDIIAPLGDVYELPDAQCLTMTT
eukprot:11407728-Karenia_brevis.AAC.1